MHHNLLGPYCAARIKCSIAWQQGLTHQPTLSEPCPRCSTQSECHQEAALTLLDTVQNNPLANNNHAHQGARACHTICTEMETLEDALWQIPQGRQSSCSGTQVRRFLKDMLCSVTHGATLKSKNRCGSRYRKVPPNQLKANAPIKKRTDKEVRFFPKGNSTG